MRSLPSVLAVVAALAIGACGDGGGERADTGAADTPVPVEPTTTPTPAGPDDAPEPSPDSEGAAECSAAGLSADVSDEGLPAPVAEKRAEIVRAAVACDYDALAALAAPRFAYSFGAPADPAQFWRERERAGDEPLRILAELLRLPHVRLEGGIYAWPTAHGGSPTESDWEQLEAIYSPEEIALLREREGEGYLGYRVGITRSGEWRFFVAGD